MTGTSPITTAGNSASLLLGRTLDGIPFSTYHLQLILVLGTVGFVEGYDLALGGSLLVLAKEPLHLTAEQVRWLGVAPILFLVLGAFVASAISDRISRKTVMQIGIVASTFFTLLIPLAQTGTQLIIIRVLTGIGIGFVFSAPFPIGAELMPARHRRTFGAIYEVMLASAFAVLPFVSFVLADNPDAFRLIALPGGELVVGNLEVGSDFENLCRIGSKLREEVFGLVVDVDPSKPVGGGDRDDAGNGADFLAVIHGHTLG